MKLVEGPFRHFAAAWRFQALGEKACKVEFSMEFEFASRALAALLQPVFEHIADSMVDAFTRRANEIHDPKS
jgi:ribosome-associated toxin RatA of RatAB toxin-antitoxin module